jgi:hypothetical protein
MTTLIQDGKPTSFYLSELERTLLEHIRIQEGHRTSKSAVIAKMIVQDAERRGININDVAMTITAIQEPAS